MSFIKKIKNPNTPVVFLLLAAIYFAVMASLLFASLRWQFVSGI